MCVVLPHGVPPELCTPDVVAYCHEKDLSGTEEGIQRKFYYVDFPNVTGHVDVVVLVDIPDTDQSRSPLCI